MPTALPESPTAFAPLFAAAAALDEALLTQLWRQWRAIGASAALGERSAERPVAEDRAVVDPEALLLISLLYAHREPRLADLMADWAMHNVDLLSVQRLRNLANGYPAELREQVDARLAWFAEIAATDGGDPRWKPLRRPTDDRDAIPIRHGQGRRAVRAPLAHPTTLMLSLRLGLGVAAKADMVAFLLASHDWHTVRHMADAVGYTVSAIRTGIEELAQAGWVELRHGQPAHYRARWSRWGTLLGIAESDAPRWRYWHQRFLYVTAVSVLCEDLNRHATDGSASAYAAGVAMRQLLEQHRSTLAHDEIASWAANRQVTDWLVFGTEVVQRMATAMGGAVRSATHAAQGDDD